MITCRLTGGLGNQLFQIFALIAFGLRTNRPFILPAKKREGDGRATYWNTFLSALEHYTNSDQLITDQQLEAFPAFECGHGYTPIESPFRNVCLSGFFQGFRYFKTEYSRIYEMIDIDRLKTQVGDIPRPTNDGTTVSLHYRIGDYADKQCYHPVLKREYYEGAVRHILQSVPHTNIRFYVFYEESDRARVDECIRGLSDMFVGIDFWMMDPVEDWKHLLMMSKCDHHIIANSTFSWWGAVFSRNRIDEYSRDKVVCYPSVWYGHQLYYIQVEDLFPQNWVSISAYTNTLYGDCDCLQYLHSEV